MEKTTISSGLDGLATMLIQRLQKEARIPQAGTTDRSQVVEIAWAHAGCEGFDHLRTILATKIPKNFASSQGRRPCAPT